MTRKNRQDPTEFKATKRADLRGRYGEALKAHPELMDLIENYVDLQADAAKYRDQIDELEARIPEGARVLTPEETKIFEAYVTLGKPEDITKRLTDGEEAQRTASKLSREKTLVEAASELGWNPKAFSRLDQLSGGLQLEVKETNGKDGKPIKAVYHTGPDGKPVPLQEFVQANFDDLLPSLTAGSQQKEEAQQRFIQQRAGGDPPKTKTIQEIAADKAASGEYTI